MCGLRYSKSPISRLRFSAVVPCNKVHRYQNFRETFCLHFVACSWRYEAHIYNTMHFHIAEIRNRNSSEVSGEPSSSHLLLRSWRKEHHTAEDCNQSPSFLQQHSLFFTVLGKVQTEYHAQQLQLQLPPARRRVFPPDRPVLSTRRLTVERYQF